ncbi:MAG: hypothetical protein HYR56_16270 [Acidobacteria bacterium]|nr:hypothetical protein [Acidobacteriota bacterium]MBI3424566.1 hypothetical protein [Acidobacteriota bacterium]
MKNAILKRTLSASFAALLTLLLFVFAASTTSFNPATHAQELQDKQDKEAKANANDAFDRAKKPECIQGALAGRFSYIFDGSIVNVGVTKAVGVLTVGADGTLSFQDTQSIGGQILRRTFTGTYQLKPDCTATAQFSTGTSADLVVDNDGNGLKIIITTPGVIITGIGQRIFNL